MMTRLQNALRAAPICALIALTVAPFAADARSPVEPDQPAAKAKKQCFYTRNADSFAAPDEDNLYIRVGVRDVYHFTMFARCPEIDWNQRLALVSHSSSWICSGMDADVITHTTIGTQRCPVRYVEKLTPAQVAALPRRARP